MEKGSRSQRSESAMESAALQPLDSGDGGGLYRAPPGGEDALSVNALLHSQLRSLRSERASLSAALAAAREEHTATARQWEAERRQLAGSDAAAARIMELARRQRHLTAELEAERARRRRLEVRFSEAPAVVPAAPPAGEAPEAAPEPAEAGESAAQLRERLRDTTRRLVEARNQAGAARRELRQAERLLQQEVGEGASVQQLLAAGAGWRGRAQQIVTLRAQLQELQTAPAPAPARSEPRLSAADCRARSHLRSLGREQQAQAEQAQAEAQRQAEEAAALRQKLDAARSRAAVLAQETSQLREQTARLSEKCRNDDEMIELLEAQVRRLETEVAEGGRAAARQAAPPVCGEQVSLLRAQLAAREAEVARLQRQLAERPAVEESPPAPSPPPVAAESEELSELRRRCLEAEFTAEAAAAERRRLGETLSDLQRRLSEAERRGEEAAGALAEERRAAAAARREGERLRQLLGRGRRTAPPSADQPAEEAELLRREVQRLTERLAAAGEERQRDMQTFQETMEEARAIFCRGLRQAQAEGVAG